MIAVISPNPPGSSGGTIPSTTNLLKGNGSGSASDSGIAPSNVALLNVADNFTTNGATSTPPLLLSGTWFTGGDSTTTKPQLLIEPAGTTSANWSTSGTGLGVNAPSGFVGNLLDLQLAGGAAFKVTYQGIPIVNSVSAELMSLQGPFGTINLQQDGNNDLLVQAGLSCNNNFFIASAGGANMAFLRGEYTNGQLSVMPNTNPAKFNVVNSSNFGTTFERFTVDWQAVANVCTMRTEAGAGGGTLRGLNIGGATTDLVGLYGATPVVQPATTGTTTGFTQSTGTIVMDASTFTGGVGTKAYRISDIVLALKQMGVLAS